VLNIKHSTSDNTSPNTNPKVLTTLNRTLNGRKGANILSHSKFLPKVVGWLGMWRTMVGFGPRLHILAGHFSEHGIENVTDLYRNRRRDSWHKSVAFEKPRNAT